MSDQTCIPVPVGGTPIVWHMDIGDKLKLKDLKYGANQQVYVTCGPQTPDTCACYNIKSSLVAGNVFMKGTLASGARLAAPLSTDVNTTYKNIHLVCKNTC